jgi:hypothetical protein
MPTDQQIAVMCDIAKSGGAGLDTQRLPDVIALLAAEYVERTGDPIEIYALTDKGQALLDERGVGVNEG